VAESVNESQNERLIHCDVLSKKLGVLNLLTTVVFRLIKGGGANRERLRNCHVKFPELFAEIAGANCSLLITLAEISS
jgi:hypothetical protein